MINLGAITIGIPVGHIERICPTCRSVIKLRGVVRIGNPSLMEWYCPVCGQVNWIETWGREWIVDKVITRGPDPIPFPSPLPPLPGVEPKPDDTDWTRWVVPPEPKPKTDWVKIGLISLIGIIGLAVVIKTIKD